MVNEQPGSILYTLPAFFISESEEKLCTVEVIKSMEFTNKQK